MDMNNACIYSFFYSGDGHAFYVKLGRSENVERRMKEHKRSNPLLEEGPVIRPKGYISWAETTVHNICKELYEEIAPEHYKLTVEDRIDFEKTLTAIETSISNSWNKLLKDLKGA